MATISTNNAIEGKMRCAIALAISTLILCYLVVARKNETKDTELHVINRYLLVSLEADNAWQSKHDVFLNWNGKSIALPVVFRLKDHNIRNVGAGAELEEKLSIGNTDVPIEIKPPTPVRVANELSFGVMPTSEGASGNEITIASWVTVTPLSSPGRTNPSSLSQTRESNNKELINQINRCLQDGKIIDVTPGNQ